MKNKPLVRYIVALCLMLILGTTRVMAENVTIAVSKTPLSSPFYIAHEQGYFKKNGVQVEIQEVIGGHRAMQAMLSDEAQFATCSDMVITSHAIKGHDYRVLASFVRSPKDGSIVARKDAGIQSEADLAGKKIGVTRNTSSHYYLDAVLLLSGVLPSEVSYVETAPENMEKVLVSGAVDAVATWQPWSVNAAQALKGNAITMMDEQAYTLSFNLVSTIENSNSAEAKAILKSLIEAERFINENPSQAKNIMAKALNMELSNLEKIWDAYEFAVKLEQSLVITLENEFRWLNSNNAQTTPMINFLELIDIDVLKSVAPEKVSILK